MKQLITVCTVLAMVLSLAACGSGSQPQKESSAAPSGPAAPGAVTRITIGTAGTSGALYPMGVAMAETITNHVEGISATGEATAASIENLRNLHEGKMGMAISQTEVASFAYNGTGAYEGNAYPDIRAMFATINNYLQVFTLKDSGIHSIADLKGKTVSMGSAGSGGELAARALLAAYGLDYTSLNAQFMGEADGAAALSDGKIDAMIATNPLNSASLTELTTSCSAVLLPIEAEVFYQLYPAYLPYTVPAGTYPHNDTDVVIPRSRIIMCTSTNSGLGDDDIYEITKAIWENRDEWASSAKSVETQAIWEDVLLGIDIPLHPGAVRYLEEKGLTVPDHLKG